MDVQKAFDAGFDAVKRYVDGITDQVEERLIALEKRTSESGAPGERCIGLADIVRDADGNLIAVMSDGRTKSIGNIAVRDGLNGKDGSDGIGLAAAIQDADGNLIVTDTKGGAHNVGRVRGFDGVPGKDGKDGASGSDGKDGRDGFSLEHFSAKLLDDGRTVVLSFSSHGVEQKAELRVPTMIYRGVWKDGVGYQRGDTVTWGGSLWHCDADDTSEKPDSPAKHWTLATKRGRDGKDGNPGERGEKGADGKPGRDLTQLGADGSKW